MSKRGVRDQGLTLAVCAVGIILAALTSQPASAVPVELSGFTGYGYNTIDLAGNGYDGLPGAIGCGPTTGTMIWNYYMNTAVGTPSLSNPLPDSRSMGGPSYMNVNPGGFGSPADYQNGFTKWVQDFGTTSSGGLTTTYTLGITLQPFDTYLDPSTYVLNTTTFLDFIKGQIDAGNPVSLDVYGDPTQPAGTEVTEEPIEPTGGADHWMPCVGYDMATDEWAGYNTWDNTLHWYTPSSLYVDLDPSTPGYQVDNMAVGYARTYVLSEEITQGPTETPIPEPATMTLLGIGLAGLVCRQIRKRGAK